MSLSELDLAMLLGKARLGPLSEEEVNNLQTHIDNLNVSLKASLMTQKGVMEHAHKLEMLILDSMLGGDNQSTG